MEGRLTSRQWEAIAEEVRLRRRRRVAELFEDERDWRLYPGDGGDPAEVSPEALAREVEIETEARARVVHNGDDRAYQRALAEERDRLKHFPVVFVSAPHIDSAVNGTFPGMPTPLLYATALLDRYLQIDEFPARRVPRVVAVMNPALYNDAFVDELVENVEVHRPWLVAVSNLSEGHYFALEVARIVKAVAPETIVLVGGQHEDATNPLAYRRTAARADALPASFRELYRLDESQLRRADGLQTLAQPAERDIVDFVAAGDGPYLMLELVRLLAENPDSSAEKLKHVVQASAERFGQLPGSSFLFFYEPGGARLVHVETSGTPIDANKLPFISIERLTHENRFPVFDHKLTTQVMACTGCKYACAFCHESADHLLYGLPKLLQRTAAHVVKELDLRLDQGFEAAFFDDSTFTQNPRWVDDFLTLLEERRAHGRFIEWGCQTTINDVSPPLLTRMGQAGCTYTYFGFESARPEVEQVQKMRRVLGRGADWSESFRRAAAWCNDAGIRVGTSLQFGLGESAAERVQTLELVARLYEQGYIAKGCVALNINAPYPGTEQWVRLLRDSTATLPDYRQKLVRHPAFETAHQFTRIRGAEADAIYEVAVGLLGDAVLSVDFSAHDDWRRQVSLTA
jgi:radical SAM superfamily enzyme YgiQ (UPF0313 family)